MNSLRAGSFKGFAMASLRGLLQGFRAILREDLHRAPVNLRTYKLIRYLKSRGTLLLEEIEHKLPPFADLMTVD
jgi:hypothetical protein